MRSLARSWSRSSLWLLLPDVSTADTVSRGLTQALSKLWARAFHHRGGCGGPISGANVGNKLFFGARPLVKQRVHVSHHARVVLPVDLEQLLPRAAARRGGGG